MLWFPGRFLARTRRPPRRVRIGLVVESLEPRAVPTLLGNKLFPADNPWNQAITTAPVASNSTAIINNITTLYGNGRPDLAAFGYTLTGVGWNGPPAAYIWLQPARERSGKE